MSPIQITGFNKDLVVEKAASGPPYSSYAVELNPGEGMAFYEAGLPGKSYGLPASRAFTSEIGDGTVFQFQSYSAPNALVLSGGTISGTLVLSDPQTFGRVALIAHSASGGGMAIMTLHFTDGSNFDTVFDAPDWFNNAGNALSGVERIDLDNASTQGAPTNPRFYQTTIDLDSLLGTGNRSLAAITFEKVASAGSTAVYALSGEVSLPKPAVILKDPEPEMVLEATPVSFTSYAGGFPTPGLQWLRNGVPVPNATNSVYAVGASPLSWNGSSFSLVATNFAGGTAHSVTSAPALLTVLADINPPALVRAHSSGLTQVQVVFSEPISLLTATNPSNYLLQGPLGNVSISSLALDISLTNVLLVVPSLADGSNYVLSVSGVRDRSVAGNLIPANSSVSFVASVLIPAGVGDPALPGLTIPVPGGFNITGAGADIGQVTDQYYFSYQPRTGDFDVRVRVQSLTLADAWSEAGLVAREDLLPGGRAAGVFATPSIAGCFFKARSVTNSEAQVTGGFPVSFPNTWLRLQRTGNIINGYAGVDGLRWTALGSSKTLLAATVFLGFAVSSANASTAVTAAFRDFQPVTNALVAEPLSVERPGQSTIRGPLVFSEIMYHPTNSSLEFVEVLNTRGEPMDIGKWEIEGSITYTFPTGTTIPAGGILVIARNPGALEAAYGLHDVLGPFTNNLPNSKGELRLLNKIGGVFLDARYDSEAPWPITADGGGHSLVLARPSFGEQNPAAWAASSVIGGSPAQLDPQVSDPLSHIRINEFLAHTDPPDYDYVELYNPSAQPADVSGCSLSDDPDTNRFLIPPGTVIPPFGFVWFSETNLNFALSAEGETIWLKNADQTRMLDAVKFGGQENGVASGRFPDGAEEIYRLQAKTLGGTNAPPRIHDIVINEIMYHPISEDDNDQYLELYNRGGAPVDLGGWKLTDGISYTFSSNQVIAANGYLVVARAAARLLTNYPSLNPALLVGNFSGSLSGRGERVALTMPDTVLSTNNAGVIKTNLIAVTVDEVTYGTGGRWPEWSDGGGSSLELRDPHADHRQPSNWADSDETRKAPWTMISATGTLDNGSSSPDQLQVLLMGAGECLIDNVQVIPPGGTNLVANPAFESSSTGWTAEGTMSKSTRETTEGQGSSRSYHLRAVERGDNQLNRVRTGLSASLSPGTSGVTLKAAARWLRGSPEILLRLRGNWLECGATLSLPVSPGTPGARNSAWIENTPPAITQVLHQPLLPQNGEPITIIARIQDPDGISAVDLAYRLDPAASYTFLAMVDDGTGPDAVANDGLFSARIPGQSTGSLLAFYVRAIDRFSPAGTGRFPADAPAHECLVRVGETQPTGHYPVYRIWMTQSTYERWRDRPELDNTPLDITFVLDNSRVIYNAQALYAGSPYIAPGYSSPTSGRCGYTITFPEDDRFLGGTDLVLDWPGGHGNETTAMQEQLGYWVADQLNLAFSHRYTIRLHVIGVTDEARRAVFEAVQQPAKDYVEQWSPDRTSGDFFKVDRAFEFNNSGGMIADPQPRLQNFTTTGGLKKREKYRWNFMFRGSPRVHDYTNLFALVDAIAATKPEPYTAAVAGLADTEQWMRVFAVSHIINNFDAYGHAIGKNMYAWRPDGGKWQFFLFDLDWLMLAANGYGFTASSGPLFNSEDPEIGFMYGFPPFARSYWRAVEDAIAGPFAPENYNPVMDAKYRSLQANGIKWCDGQSLTPPTAVRAWFAERRAFLQSQLVSVAAPFAVNPSVTVNNGVGIVSGVAPVGVVAVAINGTPWQVTWTSVNTFTAMVPLVPGNNGFAVTGLDTRGQISAGASNYVSVTYAGTTVSPVGNVVFNEIMFNPLDPEAQYVELFNNSTSQAFDLSGFKINGLGYTFPGGSVIQPLSYLMLVKGRLAANIAYGAAVKIVDEFSGSLQSDGETLSLLQPGLTPEQDLVVDRVRYEAVAPWATPAGGTSLQAIAPMVDNSRVGNWATGTTSPVASPQWVYFWTNVTPGSSRFYLYMTNAGDIYLDDLRIVAGSSPHLGANAVINGDFELPLAGTWNLAGSFASSTLSTAVKHTGNSSLHIVATAGGTGSGNSIYQDLTPSLTNGTTYTLSFWYLQGTGGVLAARFSGAASAFFAGQTPYLPAPAVSRTPGAVNSVKAVLPEFPTVWLNEVLPENVTGPSDNFGQRDPWIELYNPGTNVVSLSGYYLGTNYASPTLWAFPPQATIAPGQFLTIWSDGQPDQDTGTVLHTNFKLAPAAGTLALSRYVNNNLQIVDCVTYSGVPANHSFGDVPDGQPFYRQTMYLTTLGTTNSATQPGIQVSINEWMTENTSVLVDPATTKPEDWFELYNPSETDAPLSGYFLTDNLADPFQFQIPAGFKVPARGYLLVWADSKASANTNTSELHVSFKLDKDGEALGLFAPSGLAIDAVSFGAQSANLPEGRIPDGGSLRLLLPTPTPRTANIPPPALTPPALSQFGWASPGVLSLTFGAWPGHLYRVEYKPELSAPAWIPLGADMLAPAGEITVQDSGANAGQRFYRVLQIQ